MEVLNKKPVCHNDITFIDWKLKDIYNLNKSQVIYQT